MVIYPVIVAAVIALDQITKYMVRSGMQPGDSIPVLGDWFRILYVRNTGTAFSMFAGNKWITIVLTSVLILACLAYVAKESYTRENDEEMQTSIKLAELGNDAGIIGAALLYKNG